MAELGESMVLTPNTMEFIAYERRWKLALVLLGRVGFVAIGVWFVVEPEIFAGSGKTETRAWSVGLVTVLFFGALSIEAFRRLIWKPEVLEFGKNGIRYTRWSSEWIPWSSIRDVRKNTRPGRSTIQILLRDRTQHPGRQPMRFTQAIFRGLTGVDFEISLMTFDRTYRDAVAAIERFRSKAN